MQSMTTTLTTTMAMAMPTMIPQSIIRIVIMIRFFDFLHSSVISESRHTAPY